MYTWCPLPLTHYISSSSFWSPSFWLVSFRSLANMQSIHHSLGGCRYLRPLLSTETTGGSPEPLSTERNACPHCLLSNTSSITPVGLSCRNGRFSAYRHLETQRICEPYFLIFLLHQLIENSPWCHKCELMEQHRHNSVRWQRDLDHLFGYFSCTVWTCLFLSRVYYFKYIDFSWSYLNSCLVGYDSTKLMMSMFENSYWDTQSLQNQVTC